MSFLNLENKNISLENKLITQESDHQKRIEEFKEKLNEKDETIDEIIETEGYQSETIQINIPQIKSILYSRLKTCHEKHIDKLFNQYDLKNKKEIEKSLMEKILFEAIHLN